MEKEYRSYLLQKTDEELIRIIFFEKKKYKKEAISVAKEIIEARNLTRKNIDEIRKEIAKQDKIERLMLKKKENKSGGGCLTFIFEVLLNLGR